jgi:DNA polymerase III subunit epsilon
MLKWVRNAFYRATLGDQTYRYLFKPGPADEAVIIDCETTGLNPRRDDVIAIAAIKVRGNTILTSEPFRAVVRADKAPTETSIRVHGIRMQEVAAGRQMHQIMPELLSFIGGRPIVGYYVDFDVAMLDKYVLPFIEAKLPNQRIEISAMYYALKYRHAPQGTKHDLRFASILSDLGLPALDQHDAFNDALMTAMMYVQLRDMLDRGIRIGGERRIQNDALFGA